MNGLFIIVIVFVVAVWFVLKYLQAQKEQPRISLGNGEGLKKILPYLKWGSIFLGGVSTFLLKNEIRWASKLSGAEQAQADFGIFWVFAVYVIPSILFVIFSAYLHFKYGPNRIDSFRKLIADPFVVCAIFITTLPLYFFVCR